MNTLYSNKNTVIRSGPSGFLSLLTSLLIFSWLFFGWPGIQDAYASTPAVETFSVVSIAKAGSIEVGMPSGTVERDLLVAIMSTDGSSETLTAPGDWTPIEGPTGTGHTSRSWYKIAGASEAGPYTFTVGSDEDILIGILRISGAHQIDPIDVSLTGYGSSSSPTAAGVETTVADTLILRYFGADHDDITQDSGYPDLHTGVYLRCSPGGSGATSSGVAYTTKAGTGSTGTAAFSLTNGEEWSAVTIAVKTGPRISSSGNQEFEVGQTTTAIAPITITEASYTAITTTYGLRIAIAPAVDMLWDTSVTTASFDGDGSDNVSNPISYDPSGRVLIIPVGTVFGKGETLTIEGLYFKDFATANVARAGLQLFLGGSGDTAVDSWDDKTIEIKGRVILADHFQGQVGDQFTGEAESTTTTEFFQFRLTNDGEQASTTLTVDLSKINGIVTGDITDAEIWADVDEDSTGSVYPDGLKTAATAWSTGYDTDMDEILSLTFDSTHNVIYAGTNKYGGECTIIRCDTSTGCDDGVTDWTSINMGGDLLIQSLIFDSTNNVLYAGDDYGTIFRCDTSTGCDEATDWTTSYATGENNIYSMIFDSTNNVIYAGSGPSGIIFRCDTSTGCDAASDWSIGYNTDRDSILSLTFDPTNNVLYAGSSPGGKIFRCATSTGCDDGATDWTIGYTTTLGVIESLTFDSTNNVVYAGRGGGVILRCATSSLCGEDSDWTTGYSTSENHIYSLTFDSLNNVVYAGSGQGGLIYSCATSTGCDDGATDWTSYDASGISEIRSLIFDSANHVLYAGSIDGGFIFRKFEGDYELYTDLFWVHRDKAGGFYSAFQGIAHDDVNGLWVAVGQFAEIQTSPDGINWTHHDAADGYSNAFTDIAHDDVNDLWMTIGALGGLQSSSNGVDWTQQSRAGTYTGSFSGIAHNGSVSSPLWVIVGGNSASAPPKIQTSPNGVDWTEQSPGASFIGIFKAVAHDGSGLWVTGGWTGEIQTSTDGTAWSRRSSDGGYEGIFNAVAHDGSGLWVAVGTGGEIQTSPDGTTWTHRPAAGGFTSAFEDIAYDGSGLWVAVGDGGEIQTSVNGITWIRSDADDFSGGFEAVAHDGSGLWVAVSISAEIQNGLTSALVDIDGSAGTISFNSTSILPAGTMDYLLRATISNIADGDTLTFDLSPSGVVATGELSGQSLAVSGSVASVTHLRGTGLSNLAQIHYRWHNDDGIESAATWAASEDTALSSLSGNTPIRLRFEISNEGFANSSSTAYLLEYATSTDGPWVAVPVSTTTEHWEMVGSTYFTDGTATSNIDPGLSDENTTFFPGKHKDTSNQTAGITLTDTEFTEIEYCIQTAVNVVADTYYFRLTNAATPLNSYNIYGEVTVDSGGSWLNSNWPYRKRLRIDSSRVPGDLTNFPVLINITDDNWIYSSDGLNGKHVRQDDGGDIVFALDNGFKLDHEIENYEPSSGELVAWVEVPSVSGSSDTFIYIYYGYASGGNQWDVDGTWDEEGDNYYKGVWHLDETSGTHFDSTTNDNQGTWDGSAGTGTQDATGRIDGAIDVTMGDIVDVPHQAYFDQIPFMISLWVKFDTIPSEADPGEYSSLVYKQDSSSDSWYLSGHNLSDVFRFRVRDNPDSSTNIKSNAATPITADTWYHVVCTVSETTEMGLYINGQKQTQTATPTNPIIRSDDVLRFGAQDPTSEESDAVIDEIRFSSTVRSADWIQTSYNNQLSPAAFYTVGIEEQEGNGGDPFDNGWSSRKKISIHASKVPSDQTNFPVLIKRTSDADLTGIQADFGDILFMASDATTKLDHQIEDYNSSTGELVAWVEVRSLSSSVDTVIFLYYGNSDAVDQENPTGAGVWEPNYKAVWHLDETPDDAESGGHKDSTANANDGTPNNFQTGVGSTDATGKIDGADDFDGDSAGGNADKVDVTDQSYFNIAPFTVSAWVKFDTLAMGRSDYETIFRHFVNGSPEYSWQLGLNDSDDKIKFSYQNSTPTLFTVSADNLSETAIWYHVVGTVDASYIMRLYINGVEQSTTNDAVSAPWNPGMDQLNIGAYSTCCFGLDGIIDEARFSSTQRSADWIAIEYNNQINPDAFYTVGIDEAEDTGGRPFNNGWSYREQITIFASEVASDLTDFPVLIRTTDSDWSYTVGHGGQDDGGDILFTASDGTTKLDHEIEKYTPSTGELVAWVRVPLLSGSVDTVIYIYYGNTEAASGDEVNQWNPTGAGVWDSNYRGVWHLDETPNDETSGGHKDSTSNNNDVTPHNFQDAGGGTTNATGQIGGANKFDGSDDAIWDPEVDPDADWMDASHKSYFEQRPFTVSLWMKADKLPSEVLPADIDLRVIVKYRGSAPYQAWQIRFDESNNKIAFCVRKLVPDENARVASDSAITTTNWYHVVATLDSSNLMKLYVNGDQQIDTGDHGDSYPPEGTGQFQFTESSDNAYWGLMDEVRFSSTVRSADWILTKYNNQKTGSTFYVVGDECDGSVLTFAYRRLITINNAQVSYTEEPTYLTDFPVLVSLGPHSTLESTAYDGFVQQSQGYDIIFRDSNGVTQLDHEIEEYDASTGTLIAWVRIPTLSKTIDTQIYMYYGNCGITSATENPAGVWDDYYQGVWHLNDTPDDTVTTDRAYDSTSNDNDGSFEASMDSYDQVGGKASGSLDFDGTDDYVNIPHHSTIDFADEDFSYSFWIKAQEADFVHGDRILNKGTSSGGCGDGQRYELTWSDTLEWSGVIDDNPDRTRIMRTSTPYLDNTWHYLTFTRDVSSDELRLYRDGDQDGLIETDTSADISNGCPLLLATASDVAEYPKMGIDELRISSKAREKDWIKTSHTNQNDPGNIDSAAFYTVGENPESLGATAVDLISFTATGQGDFVLVEWETAQEIDNLGFNLYRSAESNGSYTKLNSRLIPGLLSSVSGQQYTYTDMDVIRGALYYYMLEDVDLSGIRTMHGPVCVDWDGDGIPDDYDEGTVDDDTDDSDPEVEIPVVELYEVDFGDTDWTPSSNGSATWVKVALFRARQGDEGVSLEWETSYEIDNLGFHLYREVDGKFYRITADLVPGSVFKVGSGRDLPAGQSYVYWDGLSGYTGHELYWLDCVEINGGRASFGPIEPEVYGQPIAERLKVRFRSIARHQISRAREVVKIRVLRKELSTRQAQVQKSQAIFYQVVPQNPSEPRLPPGEEQWALSAQQAVKIYIKEDGWYRIGEPELVASGLDSGVDSRFLQLYVDGQEQSIMVTGSDDGRFDEEDAVEFYGTGLDTPFTDARVYWLVVGERPGRRLDTPLTDIRVGPGRRMRIPRGLRGLGTPLSFPYSVELKERTFYFSALRNGEEEIFFGSYISTEPVNQLVTVPHPDPSPPEEALLEVVLQGATAFSHRIKVRLNNVEVGEVVFIGQERGAVEIQVPYDLLLDGDNIVTLEAQGGVMDVSLVDYIRLTYWRTYTADEDALSFRAMGREWVTIGGFSSPGIRVVDITDPVRMFNIRGKVKSDGSGYAITIKVPRAGQRTLFVFSEENIMEPAGIAANLASSWHELGQEEAEVVIIAQGDFLESVRFLKELREQQGWSVMLVDVEDLYDEFNFGAKSPWALREFLARAYQYWVTQPRFVLLVGDASYDPRNYLGYGDFDLVPTKFVDTEFLKTASDDWFVDFNDDGFPEMAVGRLPVESAEEASAVVAKIISYEAVAGLMNEVLLVADVNDKFDFEAASGEVRSLLPQDMTVREIFRGQSSTARSDLLAGLNQGQLLVNYVGHGSTKIWKGNLLTSSDAWTLSNSPYLPFLVSMTCLNGFFQDPYSESLAETFLKAERGGAMAVWTSSGLTNPGEQIFMNRQLVRLLFNGEGLTIGEAVMRAKQAVSNLDIRRTWILFGDPTIKLR